MARTSDIDFDKIPSPRPTTSSQRNGRHYPSSPLKPRRVPEPTPDSGSSDPADQDPDLFDDYAPQESLSPPASLRRKDADEDQQEEEGEPSQKSQSPEKVFPRRKTFGRIEQEEDEDDDEQEEIEEPPQRKKPPPKTKTQSKAKKENQPREGVRRSQRERYKPLEYWRGEKLVYGRTPNAGPILVPHIKEIIRIPKEVPVPLGAKRKRGATRARSRSNKFEEEDDIPPPLPVLNPEEGWDDNTEAKCTVISFTTGKDVVRRP